MAITFRMFIHVHIRPLFHSAIEAVPHTLYTSGVGTQRCMGLYSMLIDFNRMKSNCYHLKR